MMMMNPYFSYWYLAAIIFILLGFFVYFIPTIVSSYRKTSNIWIVFIVNFFFGWSLVGWVVALFFALTGDAKHTKQCPYCFSNIDEKASKCPYCGEWVNVEKKPAVTDETAQ